MGITRRSAFKGLMAASSLSLFNIGCAGFGESRAGKGTYSFDGEKTDSAVANAHAKSGYRKGWEIA